MSDHHPTQKTEAEKKSADRLNLLPWKPWDLKDLAQPTAKIKKQPLEPLFSSNNDEQNAAVALPPAFQIDQNELQRLQQEAVQQGHQQGLDAGQKQGYEAGFQAGREAGHLQGVEDAKHEQTILTEHWQHMVTDFQQTLDALDSVIASRLMQMALTAAKQVLGQAPLCDGSALLNQIQQLIQQEPMFKGKPQLRVNPGDFERVEQHLGVTLNQHGWRLLADNQIHSGGCKVSAEDGDMDASLATRWHEICRLAAPGEL